MFDTVKKFPIDKFDGIGIEGAWFGIDGYGIKPSQMPPELMSGGAPHYKYPYLFRLPEETIPYENLTIRIKVHRRPEGMYVTAESRINRDHRGPSFGPYLDSVEQP